MIPKIIHVSWKDKNILESKSEIVQQGLINMIKINPDWDVIVYDNDDIETYLKQMMGADYRFIQDEHIVAKSDVWRLIKLYNEGGVYTDIDRLCNKSFAEVIPEGVKCVLPTGRDYDFCQDFMMSEPENPIYMTAYNMRLNLRKQGVTHIYQMGPQNYMHAVTYSLMGRVIDTNPGVDVMNQIREKINGVPFLYTYREEPLTDTLIYKGESKPEYWEEEKRKLYKEYNMKHWTGDW